MHNILQLIQKSVHAHCHLTDFITVTHHDTLGQIILVLGDLIRDLTDLLTGLLGRTNDGLINDQNHNEDDKYNHTGADIVDLTDTADRLCIGPFDIG